MIRCASCISGTINEHSVSNGVFLRSSRDIRPMQRQFHNMSVEDREMFAYNSYQERKQQQLAKVTPEQRIKYCFEFLTGYIASDDDQMKAKCYAGIAKYSELLDDSEAHF